MTDAGRLVASVWDSLPARFSDIALDSFVVMPNHIHAIVWLEPARTGAIGTTLASLVGAFKSMTTVAYIRAVGEKGWPRFETRLWERNYYEHVIRNEKALSQVRGYIANNPAAWRVL